MIRKNQPDIGRSQHDKRSQVQTQPKPISCSSKEGDSKSEAFTAGMCTGSNAPDLVVP